METVVAPHIHLDHRGVAWIDDTNTKVIEVVLDKIAYGWSPEEIHFQHPHLSLGQIFAALSYYYDHQAEMDEAIERGYREVEAMRAQSPTPLSRRQLEERLRALRGEEPVSE